MGPHPETPTLINHRKHLYHRKQMPLTDTESALLALIRETPLATPEELARRLGSTRASVNVHVSNLVKKGALLGRGPARRSPGAPGTLQPRRRGRAAACEPKPRGVTALRACARRARGLAT